MQTPAKILIVEDNPGLREHVAQILVMEDYHVLTASDGEAGLKLAHESAPDLVLCDIMMPRMDGHQLLQALRATENGSAVPFVFLTAKAERSDIRTGMSLGADDYLTKPFGADELIATVKSRLSKHRAAALRTTELMRNESLVMLSHEVRTPLNGIIGMADLLLEEPPLIDPEERQQLLRDLRNSSLRLGRTLSNLMLYLDLESARHSTERENAFTQGGPALAATAVQSAAERKSRKWHRASQIVIAHDLGLSRMPGSLLEKVIEEIVDNAFRFSPESTAVLINATVENQQICIRVEDQGCGMTPSQIATHQPFRQHGRRRQDQQGLGLGLAVARRILDFNQGHLDIVPGLEKGTTVTIRLPRLSLQS